MARLSPRSFASALLLAGTMILGPPISATATVTSEVSCDEVPGLETLPLEAGTVLLFGEIHGTAEAPDLVADTVCQAIRRGHSPVVALEVPLEETARVKAYLSSDGSADARKALLSSQFWQREYQDGRSSRAILALIEQLRRLRDHGGSLTVVLFDESDPSREPGARDRAMAQRLAKELTGEPDRLAVVLTGNVHARTTVGVRWDPDLEPMGHLLAEKLAGRRPATSGGAAPRPSRRAAARGWGQGGEPQDHPLPRARGRRLSGHLPRRQHERLAACGTAGSSPLRTLTCRRNRASGKCAAIKCPNMLYRALERLTTCRSSDRLP